MVDKETKICNTCLVDKPLKSYKKVIGNSAGPSNGKIYRQKTCNSCKHLKNPSSDNLTERLAFLRYRSKIIKYNKNTRIDRKNNRSKAILVDCRHWDSLHKFTKPNLNIEFIDILIANPCTYCKETVLMMTLDRVDNKKGHTKDNVIQACLRCNYFRRDMPFDAWWHLVPGIIKAREKGLFGSWLSKPFLLK